MPISVILQHSRAGRHKIPLPAVNTNLPATQPSYWKVSIQHTFASSPKIFRFSAAIQWCNWGGGGAGRMSASGRKCPARDEALYPQALSHPGLCLSKRDLKLCNDWLCTSSPPKLCRAVLPRAFPGRRPLTLLTTAERCQDQSHDQQCQQTPHVFFGCTSLINLRAFLEVTEVLQSLLSGSSLYPVIAWRALGSGLCSYVWAPKQSLFFGPGVTGPWQLFWHLSQDSWHFHILSEVFNGTVEEKQLDRKISFITNLKVIQLLAGKPGERPAHPDVQQLLLCDGALSHGKANEPEPDGDPFPHPILTHSLKGKETNETVCIGQTHSSFFASDCFNKPLRRAEIFILLGSLVASFREGLSFFFLEIFLVWKLGFSCLKIKWTLKFQKCFILQDLSGCGCLVCEEPSMGSSTSCLPLTPYSPNPPALFPKPCPKHSTWFMFSSASHSILLCPTCREQIQGLQN